MTQTFTPITTNFQTTCHNLGQNAGSPTLSASGINNASTAYDWFSATGNGGLATANIASSFNKSFAQSICSQAKSSLLPLVKAEYVANQLATTLSLISSSISSINSTLTSIQNPSFSSSIATFVTSYNATLSSITSSLNFLKTVESKIFVTSDSIDLTSANLSSNLSSTAALASFTGVKTYLGQLLDPAYLGNNGTSIPVITSTNGNAGNAAALATIFTNAGTALSSSNVATNFKAEYLTSTKQIFDVYAILLAGYADSTHHSGVTSTPIGLYGGIDYEVSTVGEYQALAGSPSGTIILWGGESTAISNHTW